MFTVAFDTVISYSTYTYMQETANARLRELAPAASGCQEAGFTQPSLHLLLHVCTSKLFLVVPTKTAVAPVFGAVTAAVSSATSRGSSVILTKSLILKLQEYFLVFYTNLNLKYK